MNKVLSKRYEFEFPNWIMGETHAVDASGWLFGVTIKNSH